MSIHCNKLRGQIYKELIVIESTISYFGNDYKIEHEIKHGINDEKLTSNINLMNKGKIRELDSPYYNCNINKYLKEGDGEIKLDYTGTGPAYSAAKELLVNYDLPTLRERLNNSRDMLLKNTYLKN